MGTPLAPTATHLASLGLELDQGKNKFKLATAETPLNIVQFEYQIEDNTGAYTGGYVYMSEVSFILDGTDYEYSVPVPADAQPSTGNVINLGKTIRFRYWTKDMNTPPSDWSTPTLEFRSPPPKAILTNGFVLARGDPTGDDDVLFLELDNVSVNAYQDPDNTGSLLSSSPIRFIVVYGFEPDAGADIWLTSVLTQAGDDGVIRVPITEDVNSGTPVQAQVFAVYEFTAAGDSVKYYTVSGISDVKVSSDPTPDDRVPDLKSIEYVTGVLSTTPAVSTVEQNSSLYDVATNMIELAWAAPPANFLAAGVTGYVFQVRAVDNNNYGFVDYDANVDKTTRVSSFTMSSVASVLAQAGQLPSSDVPLFNTNLEFKLIAKYSDGNTEGNFVAQLFVGQLPEALTSADVTPHVFLSKFSGSELVFSASHNISSVLDPALDTTALDQAVGTIQQIRTRLIREGRHVGGVSEVMNEGITVVNSQSVYTQREVIALPPELSLNEYLDATFKLEVWLVNDITNGKDIYTDNSLSSSAILVNENSTGWSVLDNIAVQQQSRGLILNVDVDVSNSTFSFIAVHKNPIFNFHATREQGKELIIGKPITPEKYNVEVVSSSLYSPANAPSSLVDALEFPYDAGVFVTTVEDIDFADVFGDSYVPPDDVTFSLQSANNALITTGIVNKGLFTGLTLTPADLDLWRDGPPPG